MGDLEGLQLWLGNVPGWFGEAEVLHELSLYGVRPWKCVLRTRMQGQD